MAVPDRLERPAANGNSRADRRLPRACAGWPPSPYHAGVGVREVLLRKLARQFGRPEGLIGRVLVVVFNVGNRREVKAGVEALRLRPGQTVADLGFGGGHGLRLLLARSGPGGTVHGVELSQTMLRHAGRRFRRDVAAGRLVLTEGSLTALPLPDASLDAAMTANTVYFVDDLAPVCAELARVVRPGGPVAIVIADPAALATIPFTAYGFVPWTAQQVLEALAQAGFVDGQDLPVGTGGWLSHVVVAPRP